MTENEFVAMLLDSFRKRTASEYAPGYFEDSVEYGKFLGMAIVLGFVDMDGSPIRKGGGAQ